MTDTTYNKAHYSQSSAPIDTLPSAKYHGWTNYETWRVQLEIVDEYVENVRDEVAQQWITYDDGCKMVTYDALKDYVEEVVLSDATEGSFAASYSLAFIEAVNWAELARHAHDVLECYDEEAA